MPSSIHLCFSGEDSSTEVEVEENSRDCHRIVVRFTIHLHDFKQLFNHDTVDMNAKVESERLRYMRTYQRELRAENYIHLQDALGRNDNI